IENVAVVGRSMFPICAPVYVLQGCETVRSTAIPGEAQNGAQLRGLLIDCASVSPGSLFRLAGLRQSLRLETCFSSETVGFQQAETQCPFDTGFVVQ
ncbi:hypothetical protein, partial [Brevibacillus borstelensis]|uniref:hypothetical protein n=1 Tax=Brevibacillus borstelensis TaxID=45462 RepID=UPI001D13765A